MNKKILFVNFSKSWGGGENWHFTTATQLKSRGWEVFFLVHSSSKLSDRCKENGLKVISLKVGSLSFINPFIILKIKKILCRIMPDAVLLNASKELKSVAVQARKAGIKKIIYRRGIPKNVGMNRLNIFIFKTSVTHIIANSKTTLNALQPLLQELPHIKAQVIYNGLECKQQETANHKSNTIAVVARLSPEKGVDRAIAAMVYVVKHLPTAKLLIIGDGNEGVNLKKQVSDAGLEANVQFAGFSDKVSSLLKNCSIFILPSRMEGFGFVLLEAMRMKMPCIAFSNTAAAEIIKPNETGILVENGDNEIENLASAITKLLANKELLREMGCNGYAHFSDQFTLKKAIANFEKLLLL